METNEKVLSALKGSDKPLKGAEIAVLAGLESKEVTKAIKKLKADGLVTSPKNCYYSAK